VRAALVLISKIEQPGGCASTQPKQGHFQFQTTANAPLCLMLSQSQKTRFLNIVGSGIPFEEGV
jgi:hypothetical protein